MNTVNNSNDEDDLFFLSEQESNTPLSPRPKAEERFVPSDEYYKDEAILIKNEREFIAQKNSFEKFLPVEFFHWCGMEKSGERGLLSVILEDNPEYINILNRNQENALMITCRLNLKDNVKILLEHPALDTYYANENGNFAMYAVTYRANNVINFILENHKDKIDYTCKTRINDSIYHLAARYANFRLWDEISPEHFKEYARLENNAGYNCLFLAVESFFQYRNDLALEAVIRRFDKGDYLIKNSQGLNILEFIKQREREEIIKGQSVEFLAVLKFLMGIPD